MANRNFPNSRLYTFHVMPVAIDGSITIGATGAVSSFSGLDIAGVTRLAQGIYRIQLKDNYNGIFGGSCIMQSPNTGSSVTAGAFSVGTTYKIATLGTTNFNLIGVPTGITPTVGMVFTATGVGTGTGTGFAQGWSGVQSIEILGTQAGQNAALSRQPFQAGSGGYIHIKTVGPTDASTTTPIDVNPASGSVIEFQFLLNNSSVQ